MAVPKPVYIVEFSGSTGIKHGFAALDNDYKNKIISLSVRPGFTSAIGTFEVVLPDTGSFGETFSDINTYDDVIIRLDYESVGVNCFTFKGKIDTIRTDFSDTYGYTRTFMGRDYGEALFRFLGNRSYSGSCSTCIINMTGNAGLSNDYSQIAASPNIYFLVLSADSNYFDGMREISDFDNRDFYVDTTHRMHWWERQSLSGANTFTAGENIFSYRYIRDITDCKNDYYIFGLSDEATTTGSYWPTDHDLWTESDTSHWFGAIVSGGGVPVSCNPTSNTDYHIMGSASIRFWATLMSSYSGTVPDNIATLYMKNQIPNGPLMLTAGDSLNFNIGTIQNAAGTTVRVGNIKIRLENDIDNYFEARIEDLNVLNNESITWTDIGNLFVGPEYEGIISATGSKGTHTGSYRWAVVGNPSWFKIYTSSYIMDLEYPSADPATYIGVGLYFDNLYFATRFQWHTGSVGSQIQYGIRQEAIIKDRYNSTEYCQNIAGTLLAENSGSVTQIEFVTTGSPNLSVGYKYLVSLASEGTSGYYELIDLEHRFEDGFTSKCLVTDKKEVRTPIPILNYPVAEALHNHDMYALFPKFPIGWYGRHK